MFVANAKRVRHLSKNFIRTYTTIIEFDNTEKLYSKRSLFKLISTLSILKSCQIPLIAKKGPILMEHSPGLLIRLVTKGTYFKHFCAGESVEESSRIIPELEKEGILPILDYSVEGMNKSSSPAERDAKFDEVTNVIIKTIKIEKMAFGVVKMTGIAPTSLLEKMSKVICHAQVTKQELPLYLKEYLNYFAPRTIAFPMEDLSDSLNDDEMQEFLKVYHRLDRILNACIEHQVPLLIDAEQTYYQPAIDFFVMIMMKKYNNITIKGRPLVYNTYQMYLKDSYQRLQSDYHFANQSNVKFGAKLVRGAYMNIEGQRSEQLKIEYPIHSSIQDTHDAYHSGVSFVLDHIENCGLVIATHNQNTIEWSSNEIVKRNLSTKDPRIMFAQLYGMGDYLSLALSNAGFQVVKYIPFGPILEVMPYLSRRLVENSAMIGSTGHETRRLIQEIKRRISKRIFI